MPRHKISLDRALKEASYDHATGGSKVKIIDKARIKSDDVLVLVTEATGPALEQMKNRRATTRRLTVFIGEHKSTSLILSTFWEDEDGV